jgi:DNA-directed RNA polymerase specialized sigma24 family protein
MVPTQRPPVADADLLQRVVQRDATALIELERRHRPSLYAQAYGMLMDSTLAEGVVREVFAQLWFVADRLVVRRSLWSWLRLLAKDLARGRAGAPRCEIPTKSDTAEDK